MLLALSGFWDGWRCCGLEGRSGCSHWDSVAGAAGMVGEPLPNSLFPGDPHLQGKQVPKLGLKAKDGGGNKGICVQVWGRVTWPRDHCPCVGMWVSIPLFMLGLIPQESCWVSAGRGCFSSFSKEVGGLSSARLHPHCSNAIQSPESALAPKFIVVPSPRSGYFGQLVSDLKYK